MRLILWQAIADKRLLRGVKHSAWRLYGGPIPEPTKRLLRRLRDLPWAGYELRREAAAARLGLSVKTIDWLTKQDKARPVRPSADRVARYLARKAGQRIPVARFAWQFKRGGRLWFEHPDGGFYVQLTISRRTFRWRLKARDDEEANAIVEPVYLARSCVHEAADQWRDCAIGTSESVNASAALLEAQRRYLEALLGAGANRDKDWAELVKLLQELPCDEPRKAVRAQPEGPEQKCTRWWVKLLRLHPDHPPPGRSVRKLIDEARELYGVSERGARRALSVRSKGDGEL